MIKLYRIDFVGRNPLTEEAERLYNGLVKHMCMQSLTFLKGECYEKEETGRTVIGGSTAFSGGMVNGGSGRGDNTHYLEKIQ